MAKPNKRTRQTLVRLSTLGEYKRKQKFELQTALKLLRLPNSQWELNDERFIFENNDIKRPTSEGKDKPADQ
jgi:hypothetical protein